MSVYVDNASHKYGRMIMSHMIADTLEELHQMAADIGMRREWFQPKSFPHYDVCRMRRASALSKGAILLTTRRQLAEKMREIHGAKTENSGGRGSSREQD